MRRPGRGQGSALDTANAHDLAATLRQRGYDLYLVGANRQDIDNWAAAVGGEPARTAGVFDRYTVAETLVQPPDHYVGPYRALPVNAPFRLYRLQVPSRALTRARSRGRRR